MIAWLMPGDARQRRQFLDYWLRLQRLSGFDQRMERLWIDGKLDNTQQPRWSSIRNVLGWLSDAAETSSEPGRLSLFRCEAGDAGSARRHMESGSRQRQRHLLFRHVFLDRLEQRR